MHGRTANLLGAVAQLAIDRQVEAIAAASGLNATSAAALVTIGHAPAQTIDFLHATLQRSQSATTRLVTKLQHKGFIDRGCAEDGRAVALNLTPAGKKLVARILTARHAALSGCLADLSDTEKTDIDGLLAKILANAVTDDSHAYQICRLCDGERCDVCPIEDALETRTPMSLQGD